MRLAVINRSNLRLMERPADSSNISHVHLGLYTLGNTPPTSTTPITQIPSPLLYFKAPCPCLAPPYQSTHKTFSSQEVLSAQLRSAFFLVSTPSSFPPFCLCSSSALWQDAFLVPLPLFKSHWQVTLHILTSPKVDISSCPQWSSSLLCTSWSLGVWGWGPLLGTWGFGVSRTWVSREQSPDRW